MAALPPEVREPFPFRPPTARAYVVAVHKARATQLSFEHRPAPA